jgi:hypothetical protein
LEEALKGSFSMLIAVLNAKIDGKKSISSFELMVARLGSYLNY